jgi:hypothetical protein
VGTGIASACWRDAGVDGGVGPVDLPRASAIAAIIGPISTCRRPIRREEWTVAYVFQWLFTATPIGGLRPWHGSSRMTPTITLIPGDGIGPEVTRVSHPSSRRRASAGVGHIFGRHGADEHGTLPPALLGRSATNRSR